MSGVEGLVSAQIRQQPLQPTIEIEVDLEKAQRLGVSPGDVRRAEATLLQGIQVGSVFDDQKVFDVLVRHLEAGGKKVRYAQNITDIDESILQRADRDGTLHGSSSVD